jgi:hypothetical protein
MKNKGDTNGAPVFAPDYSITILGAKFCTNSNEHSLYIRFLWTKMAQGKVSVDKM